jgi:leucyl-tRNA synthetase
MSTANRFKKGIESATKNMEDRVPKKTSESITENILENTEAEILQKISKFSKKERGKNHSIYLSFDVENALKALSKATNQSKSSLVNEILREILIK